MALRQVRGVVPGILSQEDPGNVVFHFLEGNPTGGKITKSGLITAPLSGAGYPVVQSGDPGPASFVVMGGDPVIQTVPNGPGPTGSETKESQGSRPTMGSGLSLVPILVLVAVAYVLLK